MKNAKQYEKLFSRDFSLPSVEAWVRGETASPEHWIGKKHPLIPYIVTQRADNTVCFYYNLKDVEWIQDTLVKLGKEQEFLSKLETKVLEKLKFLKPIYEKEKAISLTLLRKFLIELEDGYPWFEAMWWYCQMDESKLVGLKLKKIQEIRAQADPLCNSSDTVTRKSLAKIYPKLGSLSSFLRTEEILSGNIPGKTTLEKRFKGYFFTNDQLFADITKSQMAKKLGICFADAKIKSKNIKQLKGNVACQGLVKGYVRRLMGHSQIHLLREGEILVSPMTIPDFLPAMKKAAAFVTDEGGILCHAAIVARELRKPCIVGTGLATEILKDGDFVEVDAKKGIVTIIR